MANGEQRGTPVYVSWVTFKNMVDRLAEHGLPSRIDKSVFVGQSGGVVSQLMTGFKFLGLIDDNGVPSEALKALVVASEAERDRQLKKVLQERYADVFALDLEKATPAQLSDTFATSFGTEGETRTKAIRFFLGALAHLGVPVSTRLVKPKPGTSGGVASARRRRARATTPPPTAVVTAAPGLSRSVSLGDGITLTLTATGNLFGAGSSHLAFIFGLVKQMEEHEQGNSAEKGEPE